MKKAYTGARIKQILRQEIKTSEQTEEKIQEAYRFIRADAAYQTAHRGTPISSRQEGRQTEPEVIRVRRAPRRWIILAAAAVSAAALSVTAVALGSFFTRNMERKDGSLSYQFKVNYELQPTVVEMTPTYIPEGYEQMEGALKWCADGKWQNGISLGLVNASDLEVYGDTLNVDNAEAIEETTINGMEADLIRFSAPEDGRERSFDKRIYVFNETDGCVGVVFGGNDLSMEELVKVAEGITYTKTSETLQYADESERLAQEAADREYQKKAEESRVYGVPEEYVYEVGEAFNNDLRVTQAINAARSAQGEEELPVDDNAQITVLGTEILDSVAGYAQEHFMDYEELVAPQLNEDGTAKPYDRITYRGSGEEIARDESVGRKFLKVELQAQNMGEETLDFWAGEPKLVYLEPRDEGGYDYADTWTKPAKAESRMSYDEAAIYFDHSQPGKHFYFCDLAPGETLRYTLIFAVDEDSLDNLYLEFGAGYGDLVFDTDTGVYSRCYVKV